jgi:hypothetical protein
MITVTAKANVDNVNARFGPNGGHGVANGLLLLEVTRSCQNLHSRDVEVVLSEGDNGQVNLTADIILELIFNLVAPKRPTRHLQITAMHWDCGYGWDWIHWTSLLVSQRQSS